jgi:hypothetical protein
MTETKAPEGYDKLEESIELTITYNKETGEVTSISENSDYVNSDKQSGTGIIRLKNKPVVN